MQNSSKKMLQGHRHTWFAYTCALILFVTGCSNMFFVPDRKLIRAPDDIGLDYRNITINTDDGTHLNGWLLKGTPPVKGTVVFLHGNAQNISYHISAVYWLPKNHFNVFLYDYRGYGISQGRPTIQNSIEDFRSAVTTLLGILPTQQQRLIVFGQSLGADFAIAQTARFKNDFPVRALIVDSAFSGFRRIAREKLAVPLLTRPFSPLLAMLVTNKPDILKQIALVSPVPVLIIHGKDDTIVPYRHSELLYEHARQPKQLWLVPSARHIESLAKNNTKQRLLNYINNVLQYNLPETAH